MELSKRLYFLYFFAAYGIIKPKFFISWFAQNQFSYFILMQKMQVLKVGAKYDRISSTTKYSYIQKQVHQTYIPRI